jgi:hypothetical protein
MLVHECLELTEAEATKYGEAVQRVNDLYEGGIVSPKVAAWGNLGMTMLGIYAPRVRKVFKGNKQPKPAAPAAIPAQPGAQKAQVN